MSDVSKYDIGVEDGSTEPSSESPALNDYCWLKIFQYLSIADLANVRASYKNLQHVADMEFLKMRHGIVLGGLDGSQNLLIVKQFGELISKLWIDSDKLFGKTWTEMFSAVRDNCNENVKSLGLIGRSTQFMRQQDILLIADHLKSIEELGLLNIDDTRHLFPKNYIHIVSHCENVRTVALFTTVDINMHPGLFRNNSNLVTLYWHGPKNADALKMIVDNLMNTQLEEFNVKFAEARSMVNFSELLRLRRLKRLGIDCNRVDIGRFLFDIDAVDNSLDSLTLHFAKLNSDNVATLGRIKRLKMLKLSHGCSLVNISYITLLLTLCGNKNLQHLHILCYKKHIDETIFLEIVETRKRVAGAGNCLYVTLCFEMFEASMNSIPFDLREANEDVVKLGYKYGNEYIE